MERQLDKNFVKPCTQGKQKQHTMTMQPTETTQLASGFLDYDLEQVTGGLYVIRTSDGMSGPSRNNSRMCSLLGMLHVSCVTSSLQGVA